LHPNLIPVQPALHNFGVDAASCAASIGNSGETERDQEPIPLYRAAANSGRRVSKQTPLPVSASRLRVFGVQSALLAANCLVCFSGWSRTRRPRRSPFETNRPPRALHRDGQRHAPGDHALLGQRLSLEARGQTLGHATYRIWLQKPNYARLEATRVGETEPAGILVGDGDYFWTYWLKEKLPVPMGARRQIRRRI